MESFTVVRSIDPLTQGYIGHTGVEVHRCDGDGRFPTLLVLQFQTGIREVFREEDLALWEGEVLDEDPGKLRAPHGGIQPGKERLPRLRKPRALKGQPGYCLHGHPRPVPSVKCTECDRLRKQGIRARQAEALALARLAEIGGGR